MLVVLEPSSQESGSRRIWLRSGQLIHIGRTEAADVVLSGDPLLSSRHFSVECGVDVCRVHDLKSTNGTFLNGVRIAHATLRDGDRLQAGRTTFAIHIEGGSAATERELEIAPAPVPQIAQRQLVAVPPAAGGTAGFRCASYPCRSGLSLFRGAEQRFDPGAVATGLAKAGPMYVLGPGGASPRSAASQEPRAGTGGTPNTSTGEVAQPVSAGPAVRGPLPPRELAAIIATGWGDNTLVCLVSQAPGAELQSRFDGFARGDPPFEAARYDPDLARLRPLALADFLANSDPRAVAAFVARIEAVLLEVHGGERWAIFASPAFEPALRKIGFVMVPDWQR